MSNSFRPVIVVAFVSRAAPVVRLAHQPTPAIGIVRDIDVGPGRLGCCLGHSGCAVQVCVYDVQLIEVMLVGSRAQCAGGIGARVREIIHATVLRTPVGRLVVEPEGMGDFLAHHMPLFINVVIGAGVEIGVVHLRRPLRDVNAAGNIDARQTEPTVIAVGAIADLSGSGDHRTPLVRPAADDRGEKRRRCCPEKLGAVPIRRSVAKVLLPAGGKVVSELQGEL